MGEGRGFQLRRPPHTPVYNSLELCLKFQILHLSSYTYVVSEHLSFSTKTLLILLMSAFLLARNSLVFGENVTLLKLIVREDRLLLMTI